MPWKEKSRVELRKTFVMKAQEPGCNFSELCREYNISRKTGYKWLDRFRKHGFTALDDMSRRPWTCPHEIDVETCLEIIRLKQIHPTWGPKKIHILLKRLHGDKESPARITVERILDRAGFIKHVKKRPRHQPIRTMEIIKPTAPNDVWTADFKGWWRSFAGQRCEPFTLRDEFSRFILSVKDLEDKSTSAVRKELVFVFKKYGLPNIFRFDNGQPFACPRAVCRLTKLSAWLITLGICINPTNLGSPQDNGAHERMHKDIRDDLEINGIHDQESLDLWRHEFNQVRPHEALDMKTPADVYRKSNRVFTDAPVKIVYPSSIETRIVNNRGFIRYKNQWYFISSSLIGHEVGLNRTDLDHVEVTFDYLTLGEIYLNEGVFRRSDDA